MDFLRLIGRILLSPLVLVVMLLFALVLLLVGTVSWAATGRNSKVNLTIGS